MTTRASLLDAHAHLTSCIRASEEWEPSYKRAPKQLKKLIEQEALLQASVNEYLIGLKDRAFNLVNWQEVELKPIMASVVPPLTDDLWKQEQALLSAAVALYLAEMVAIGAQAGELIYSIPLGIGPLDQAVLDAATEQTAKLVKNVATTTRKLIQTAVNQSIAQGEDLMKTVSRIQRFIANPRRAELIARTESVVSYQSGLTTFAHESGAESSTWDALSGACQLCAPLNGVTVETGKPFYLPNGGEAFMPPSHPGCRCNRTLNYPTSSL